MRYYSFLPLLLVGTLTGCAVYGGSYAHSDHDRVYRSTYDDRRYPVYIAPPRYPLGYRDAHRDDYRHPPQRFVPPPPPRNLYRPPVRQDWGVPRHHNRDWNNAYESRSLRRPPPPSPRYQHHGRETRGWEIRR